MYVFTITILYISQFPIIPEMLSSKYKRITNYTVLIILTFSTFVPALAFAAPLANNGKDWQYPNGNSWAWNYSPQDQINKDNVKSLEVKWVFPLGSRQLAPAAIQSLSLSEGSTSPPIVRNGVVYVKTNFGRIYAIDAASGKQLWAHDYTINVTEVRQRLQYLSTSLGFGHHGTRYWETGDVILEQGVVCDLYGVNAKTGTTKFWIKDLCKDVPGNVYPRYGGADVAVAGTYEKGRQFITVLGGTMHSTLSAPDSRHVTMGISMDEPYNILWRVFSHPPYDRPTKDWALQECDIGYFRDMPCSEVAKVNQAGLEWDYALQNEPPSKWSGTTANWGQPVVDEDSGIIYTHTGNQGPYSNMSLAPGPRLYGSTIMAINLNQGKRVWWLQPFPHDPYDYDCNWSGMLTENTQLGKVYTYGCKEGRYFVIDAATGKPKLTIDVRKDQYARGQVSTDPSKLIYEPDPRSYYDMREWNWISYPAKAPGEPGKFCTLPCTVYPLWFNGIFGTDRAYDPDTQTYIQYEGALQVTIEKEHPYVAGGNLFTTKSYPVANVTLVARDMATGKVKWTWFYSYSHQRAAPIVSGGTVIAGFTDGKLRFFNKDTGSLISEKDLGAAIVTQPTIGKDTSGTSKIFVTLGMTSFVGPLGGQLYGGGAQVPGTLIALGLSDSAASKATTTVTTTSATTVTTATTSTVTTTSATTVTSATTQTLTTTSATTVTTTQAPQTQTTTVTSSASAQTVTTTQQVTQTTGLPAEVTYAAVGVAVIALAAAAVLVMRKK